MFGALYFALFEREEKRKFGQRRILETISDPNLPDLIGAVGREKDLLPFGAKRGCGVIVRKLLERSSSQ